MAGYSDNLRFTSAPAIEKLLKVHWKSILYSGVVAMRLLLPLITCLLVFTCAIPAGAVSITADPHYVDPGETVTITVQGLTDNSNVTMDWEVFVDNPDPAFLWEIQDLTFPINLEKADFRITNQNTLTNKVTLTNAVYPYQGERTLTLVGDSVNGIWAGYYGNDYINGTWPVIRIQGTLQPGKTNLLTLMKWHGIKTGKPWLPAQPTGGPDDFAIPVNFSGIQSGTVKFTITVNGTNVVTDTIVIGKPVSSTGALSVITRPSGAKISLDGVYYGTTPGIISHIPPGLRRVTLQKDGYQDYTTQVLITGKQVETLMVNLVSTQPQPTGSVLVSSIPSRARIYIDDVYRGLTPRMIGNLAAGEHELLLTKDGYTPHEQTFVVPPLRTAIIVARMSRETSPSPTSPQAQGIEVYEYGIPGAVPVTRIDQKTFLAGGNVTAFAY